MLSAIGKLWRPIVQVAKSFGFGRATLGSQGKREAWNDKPLQAAHPLQSPRDLNYRGVMRSNLYLFCA